MQPIISNELFSVTIMKAVHSPKTRSHVITMLNGSNAETCIPNTAAIILDSLGKVATEAGKVLPDDVKESGAAELVALLGEVAEAAGLFTINPEEIPELVKSTLRITPMEVQQ